MMDKCIMFEWWFEQSLRGQQSKQYIYLYLTDVKKILTISRIKSSHPMLSIIIEHRSAATLSNIFILLVRYGLLVSVRSANMLINSLNISCKKTVNQVLLSAVLGQIAIFTTYSQKQWSFRSFIEKDVTIR